VVVGQNPYIKKPTPRILRRERFLKALTKENLSTSQLADRFGVSRRCALDVCYELRVQKLIEGAPEKDDQVGKIWRKIK